VGGDEAEVPGGDGDEGGDRGGGGEGLHDDCSWEVVVVLAPSAFPTREKLRCFPTFDNLFVALQ
ncbi:hypothetical protein, partial [Streptomyces sp. NPDC085466]|uniref:hypothetical protein n=1 Tax=Streptomyces sp. NPDC085466 TaxID=3365725 RepID=UPI0037CFC579